MLTTLSLDILCTLLDYTWGKSSHCMHVFVSRIFILPGEQHVTVASLCAAPSSVLGIGKTLYGCRRVPSTKHWGRERSSEWRQGYEGEAQNWEAVKESRPKDRGTRTSGLARLGRAPSRAMDFTLALVGFSSFCIPAAVPGKHARIPFVPLLPLPQQLLRMRVHHNGMSEVWAL